MVSFKHYGFIILTIVLIYSLLNKSSVKVTFFDKISYTEPLYQVKDKDIKLIDYDRSHIKFVYPEVINSIYDNINKDEVDWSKYGYVSYATSKNHVCNSFMIMSELNKFGTRAEKVILVKEEFLDPKSDEFDEELPKMAAKHNVILKPVKVIKMDSGNWVSSYTKLLIFNETKYDRIIYMDSDSILINGNLDELFFLPPAKLASVTGYWLLPDRFKNKDGTDKYNAEHYNNELTTALERFQKINRLIDKNINPWLNQYTNLNFNDKDDTLNFINKRNFYNKLYNSLPTYPFLDEYQFSSILLVIQPSVELFKRVEHSLKLKKDHEYDMDLLNFYVFKLKELINLQESTDPSKLSFDLIKDDIPEFLIIPHQVYGVLSKEFNINLDHRNFLMDPMDQPFINQHSSVGRTSKRAYYDLNDIDEQAKFFYKKVKYFHFSDHPIPKPWIRQKLTSKYMTHRARCASYHEFNENVQYKPGIVSKDCLAGEFWDQVHKLFRDTRKDICGLGLIDSDTTYGADT